MRLDAMPAQQCHCRDIVLHRGPLVHAVQAVLRSAFNAQKHIAQPGPRQPTQRPLAHIVHAAFKTEGKSRFTFQTCGNRLRPLLPRLTRTEKVCVDKIDVLPGKEWEQCFYFRVNIFRGSAPPQGFAP